MTGQGHSISLKYCVMCECHVCVSNKLQEKRNCQFQPKDQIKIIYTDCVTCAVLLLIFLMVIQNCSLLHFKLVATWHWPLSSCPGTSPFTISAPCCFVKLEDVSAGNNNNNNNCITNSNKTKGRPKLKLANQHFLSSCCLCLFTT
jgi:hypothetical protein